MSYYDNTEEYQKRGIDYDLDACLKYNPQSFTVSDIDKVLAVHQGERDEDSWSWIIVLKSGQYIYLTGWCDYTGWDCQSGAKHEIATSPEHATTFEDEVDVRAELIEQLKTHKSQTWREGKDAEFGL